MSKEKSEEESNEYRMYRRMFPYDLPNFRQHAVVFPFQDTLEYQDLWESGSARFQLSAASAVFQSMMSSPGANNILKPNHAIPNWKAFEFTHNKLVYRCRVKIQPFMNLKGVTIEELIIKLPNDGYLYYPGDLEKHLKIQKCCVKHHKSNTFVLLRNDESVHFEAIWNFADEHLGDQDYTIQIFYSSAEEQMGIKIVHDKRPNQIEITFEPGYPL